MLTAHELVGEGPKRCPDERAREIDPEVLPLARDESRANDRAGFIDAPVSGPPNRASSAIVAPIAIAAGAPAALVSVGTPMITSISNALMTASTMAARPTAIVGTVAPRSAGFPGQMSQRRRAAAVAPASCAARYVAASRPGRCRVR
jgi:hypothetical protein